MQQALEAQAMLAEQHGVAAEIYSAPSFQLLRNEALEAEHWNLHNPGSERVPYVTRCSPRPAPPVRWWRSPTGSRPGRTWSAAGCRPRPGARMGTDGYGRSDTREALRRFFDIDAQHITAAVLVELARTGALPRDEVAAAVAELDLEPDAPFAIDR